MNRDRSRRDEGAVLPLVLVMMVVSAMIVIPLLGYAVAVLKANTVVAGNTRDREAAEGAIRVALTDPSGLFNSCTGGSRAVSLVAAPVNGIPVAATCSLVTEVGPLDLAADGSPVLQTPVGTAALQLGATLPDTLSGSTRVYGPVPPYPASEKWWTSTTALSEGQIWLPELPVSSRPPTANMTRTVTYSMPVSYGCTVYLPGYYPNPVTVSSGRAYFASGVYYFEQPVTFERDADVIVGMGIHSWSDSRPASECANDSQVRANLISKPSVLGIDGGGATFIFGDNGKLVIDNAGTTGSLSVKFNQRYADAHRGGRVSIMTVNGDDALVTLPLATPDTGKHAVNDVVDVPRSVIVDGDGVAKPFSQTEYRPSRDTYTSEARAPQAPSRVDVQQYTTSSPSPGNGAVLVSWPAVKGATGTGGARIVRYDVEYSGRGRTRGPAGCMVVPTAPDTLGCVVTGLDTTGDAEFFVRATNEANLSSAFASSGQFQVRPTAPTKAPEAPTNVVVTAYRDAAAVSWEAPANNGSPITGYSVTAQSVTRVARPNAPDANGNLPPTQYDEVATAVGVCNTAATTTAPAATTCVVRNLAPLSATDAAGNEVLGYRFVVTATNAPGTSVDALSPPAAMAMSFTGDPAPADPVVPEVAVEPWVPVPVVKIDVNGAKPAAVSIPGYVSVPMGRISIENTRGQSVSMTGGILTSTLSLNDSRPATREDPLPIGYKNDIVLQRTVRIIAKAGNTAVTAHVQVNENGEFAVNSWVVS